MITKIRKAWYNKDMSDKMMKTAEFAAKYGYKQSTIQRWCRNKSIPALEINGHYRINEDEALTALREKENA